MNNKYNPYHKLKGDLNGNYYNDGIAPNIHLIGDWCCITIHYSRLPTAQVYPSAKKEVR